MGVVNVKSAAITNRDASPRVLNNDFVTGDRVKHARGVVAITSGDSTGSIYRVIPGIPSNSVPISVRVTATDVGTTTTFDVGLYKSTSDGAAVVDADAFKAAVVVNAGAITKTEVVNGNLQTVANAEKRLWELLSLTSDPSLMYDLCLTLVGAADGAGTVLIEIDYAQ